MNRFDRERIADERFHNRTVGIWQAIGEAAVIAVAFVVWVAICAFT